MIFLEEEEEGKNCRAGCELLSYLNLFDGSEINEHNLKNTTKRGKVTTEPSSTTGRLVFRDMGFV